MRVFGGTNAVDAVATHAGGRPIVVLIEQPLAVRTVLEFRQLIGRQRGIELVHQGRIGMAARAELHNPGAILFAIFLRPFLDVIMAEIGGRIAAVTTGTGDAATKMNILDDLLQVHVDGDARLRAE